MIWMKDLHKSYLRQMIEGLPIAIIKNRGKNKLRYIQMFSGFDIETTTLPNKNAYMYIWQMSINDEIILGRTWVEFITLLEWICDILVLRSTTRIIIWIANLGFEFQFLRKWFNITRVFAKEQRQPLYAIIDDCIELRDCLAITGGNLEQLAKDYTTTQKLVGDLDYSKIRNYKTELTEKELAYCINDVKILSEFSEYIFNEYIIPKKYVPLTKTGLLRKQVKDLCPKIAKINVQMCYPDRDIYKKMMIYCFQGGIVHANRRYAGKIIEGSAGLDITSSYPAVMLFGYYPVSPFIKSEFSGYAIEKKCCLIDITFYNIKATSTHSIISGSKAIESSKMILDNGRIIRAEMIRLFITEIDLKLYLLYYDWQSIRINDFRTAKRGRLPNYLLKPITSAYTKKAKLKKEGKAETTEYKLQKSFVNSGYGMTVTRMQEKEITYEKDEWGFDSESFDFSKEVQKQFLLPQWGVWVTAHARYALLSVIWKCRDDVIYYDTDSIKLLNYDSHKAKIEAYNKEISAKIKQACNRLHLPYQYFNDLGAYDLEYINCEKFKTLGAKRYIYTVDGKTKVTIAGLPKGSLTDYCEKNHKDIYDVFSDGMLMSAEISAKKTTSYNDEEHTDYVDGVRMTEKSSVGIYDIPFKMTLDKYFAHLIYQQYQEDERYEKRIDD